MTTLYIEDHAVGFMRGNDIVVKARVVAELGASQCVAKSVLLKVGEAHVTLSEDEAVKLLPILKAFVDRAANTPVQEALDWGMSHTSAADGGSLELDMRATRNKPVGDVTVAVGQVGARGFSALPPARLSALAELIEECLAKLKQMEPR